MRVMIARTAARISRVAFGFGLRLPLDEERHRRIGTGSPRMTAERGASIRSNASQAVSSWSATWAGGASRAPALADAL